MAETGMEARPPMLKPDNALFLDFDGTLVAFAQQPDGVIVEETVPRLLAGLDARLGGALALVTGRTLAQLDAILGPPRYAAAGLHGHEWRLATGKTHRSGNPVGVGRILEALRERFGADPRLLIEDKGASVALHYRRAPGRAEACMAALREVATAPDFEILPGHYVVEARPRGIHKGAALKALAGEAPFAGRRPVFVGDDRTDEDGFRAALVLGGHGVKVGPEPSIARFRLASVEAVHAWLAASLVGLGRGRTP
jgi:trehalose 6-phosphate phosphatase